MVYPGTSRCWRPMGALKAPADRDPVDACHVNDLPWTRRGCPLLYRLRRRRRWRRRRRNRRRSGEKQEGEETWGKGG